MAIAETVRSRTRENPRAATAGVTIVAYAVVLGAFAGLVPAPALSTDTTHLFSHVIAVVNTLALGTILAGWWYVRRGQLLRHRNAMVIATILIVLFLVIYIWQQAGGFTKGFVVQDGAPLAAYAEFVRGAYLVMLAIHILLSILAVPLVVYALLLGLTHSLAELPNTPHPRVGWWAALTWSTSLALGILTYLLLNHVYDWEVAVLVALAGTRPLVGRPPRESESSCSNGSSEGPDYSNGSSEGPGCSDGRSEGPGYSNGRS